MANATLKNLTDFLERRRQTLKRIEARNKEKIIAQNGEGDKTKAKPHNAEKKTVLASSTDNRRLFMPRRAFFVSMRKILGIVHR